MSFVTDIRAVSDTAIEQLADRFDDLPRPLLAAIGAGDLAVEQWAALRETLIEQFATVSEQGIDSQGVNAQRISALAFTTELSARAQHAANQYAGKVQQTAGEYAGKAQQVVADIPGRAGQLAAQLPGKAQQTAQDFTGRAQQVAEGLGKTPQAATQLPQRAQAVAAQVANSIGTFAGQIPARAQELLTELPEKIAEFSGDLTVETLRDTVDAYTELVGSIYGSLADRGDRTWSRVRSSPLRPGTVVNAAPDAAPDTPRRSAGAVAKGNRPTTRRPLDTTVTTAAPETARAARSAAAKEPVKVAPKTKTGKPGAAEPSGIAKGAGARARAAKAETTSAAPSTAARKTAASAKTAGPAAAASPEPTTAKARTTRPRASSTARTTSGKSASTRPTKKATDGS